MATYEELSAHLDAGKDKGERAWDNNTRIRRSGTTEQRPPIIVRLHNTDIATVYQDNRIVLNSGGWLTATTKDRLNKVLGGTDWRVWSNRGIWKVYHFSRPANLDQPTAYIYQDGVTLWPDGTCKGAGEDPTKRLKEAKAYVKKLVDALFDGTLEAPGNGDCWYCRGMFGESGLNDADHLNSHIEEGYLVPALLDQVLSAKDAKMGPLPRSYAWEVLHQRREKRYANLDEIAKSQLRRATWVWLATRIGLPV
jgi:hypothetical protein